MRQSYIDAAVGYVDLCREGEKCLVRGKICPEHNIGKKLYDVETEISGQEILSVKCKSCAASEGMCIFNPSMMSQNYVYEITFSNPLTMIGGCKHATAFLMWLHQKSSDRSPTEVACYWKKPALSRVSMNQVATLQNFGKPQDVSILNSSEIVDRFLEKLTNRSNVLYARSSSLEEYRMLDMHFMGMEYKVPTSLNSYYP